MLLSALDVRGLRIVERAAFEASAANFFVGPNGAGKTTLLEAIHLLGRGQSFLSGRSSGLVREGCPVLRIVGRVVGPGNRVHRVGLEKGAGGYRKMRMDGRGIGSATELARVFPVVAIHPGSHELLAGGPEERRRLLDWGLFHVEQGYLRAWQRYRRVLEQRNAILRRGRPVAEVAAWEPELARAGEALDWARGSYVEQIQVEVEALVGALFGRDREVALEYQRGWRKGHALAEELEAFRDRDRERGSTVVGPHRAELVVSVEGRESRNRVSRGQQKLLVYVLRAAQVRHMLTVTGQSPALLLDDPCAELDPFHRERVLTTLLGLDCPVFATAVDATSLPTDLRNRFHMFHVEQGAVSEVVQ